MSFYSVDVEADGPAPGIFSMLSVGVVRVDEDLKEYRYWELRPISNSWDETALSISGLDREKLKQTGDEPSVFIKEMQKFISASNQTDEPIFVSDNPAFDFAFVNYYFHRFSSSESGIHNPFGHKAKSIPDVWLGSGREGHWKALRETAHTHNALDDAMGNAEAVRAMLKLGVFG